MIPTGPKLQPDFGLHPIISACNYFSNTSSTICRDAVDLTKPIFVYPEIGFYGLSVVFSVVVIISLWDKIKGSCCESKKINKNFDFMEKGLIELDNMIPRPPKKLYCRDFVSPVSLVITFVSFGIIFSRLDALADYKSCDQLADYVNSSCLSRFSW